MDAKSSQCRRPKMHSFRTINLSSLTAIRVIKSKLNPSQQERFKASCFGRLFGISTKLKFSSSIVDHILSRQVDRRSGGDRDEMWFEIRGQRARFSLHEFALVTGLNCGNYPSRAELEGEYRSTRLRDKYFQGLNAIDTSCLKHRFVWCSDEEDTYRLSLVYFLQALLLSRDTKSSIDELWLSLADDLESFDKFPWGRVSYELTTRSLERPMRLAKSRHWASKFCLGGFPFAFLVWVYEAVPLLGSEYAKKKKKKKKAKDLIPRILRWESSQVVRCKNLRRSFFGLDVLNVLKKLRASEFESEQDYMQSIGESNHTLGNEDSDCDATSHTQERSDADSTDDLSSDSESETFPLHIMELKKKMKKLKHIEERNYEEERSEVLANISWVIRNKGKRKSRKRRTMNVKEMELLEWLNESQKLNNCLQAFVFKPLGRENASMGNGDISLKTEPHHVVGTNEPDRDVKCYDFDAFVCDSLINDRCFSQDFLEQLDVVIQHELDLDFSGERKSQP